MARRPAAEIAKTIAWERLRACVDALRGLIRVVDDNCRQAEQDLSPGIARRRTQVGRQALTELESFKPFQLAEKAVANDLALLAKRMVDLPPPTNVADVMLVSRFRRSYFFAALSDTNVGIKGTLASL